MKTSNRVTYQRTKDSLTISGEGDSVKPFIKSDQRLQWFKAIVNEPFIWLGKLTGIRFLMDYINRIRSG